MMGGAALLVVIERGYRGSVEVQFSDLLYVCRGLHAQLGGVDLVLRGSAVSFAVDAKPVPPVRIGTQLLDATPDPRRSLRELLAAGVNAWVDEADLTRCGFTVNRLISGVVTGDTVELAASWPEYQGVWFL
jgi:hypothetical protein